MAQITQPAVNQRMVFQSAMRLVPPSEGVKKHSITVFEGDLYFMSSTRDSWFIIFNFMDSDSNFITEVENMIAILSIAQTNQPVVARSIDGSNRRIRFTSGAAKIDSGVMATEERPNLPIPDASNFSDIPAIYHHAARFNNLEGDALRMNAFRLDSNCFSYIIEDQLLCGIIQLTEDNIDEMHCSRVFPAMNEAVRLGGRYQVRNRMLYLHVPVTDDEERPISVLSCMRVSASMASNESKVLISRHILSGTFGNRRYPVVTMSLSDYIKAMTISKQLTFNGTAEFRISGNVMRLKISDNYLRVYEQAIPVEYSGELFYSTFILDKSYLDVITCMEALSKKKDTIKINMHMMIDHKKMLVTSSEVGDEFFPFVFAPIKFLPR